MKEQLSQTNSILKHEQASRKSMESKYTDLRGELNGKCAATMDLMESCQAQEKRFAGLSREIEAQLTQSPSSVTRFFVTLVLWISFLLLSFTFVTTGHCGSAYSSRRITL